MSHHRVGCKCCDGVVCHKCYDCCYSSSSTAEGIFAELVSLNSSADEIVGIYNAGRATPLPFLGRFYQESHSPFVPILKPRGANLEGDVLVWQHTAPYTGSEPEYGDTIIYRVIRACDGGGNPGLWMVVAFQGELYAEDDIDGPTWTYGFGRVLFHAGEVLVGDGIQCCGGTANSWYTDLDAEPVDPDGPFTLDIANNTCCREAGGVGDCIGGTADCDSGECAEEDM